METSLLQDLRAIQRMTPSGITEILIKRDVFDEIVNTLADNITERDSRQEVIDELMPRLTPIETRIVKGLHDANGQTVPVEKFRISSTESAWVHIRRLREKLKANRVPFRVETVRERGYRIVWEDDPDPTLTLP